MKHKKFLALLGAAVLSLGVVGTAFAVTGASDQGITPTTHDGNITLSGNGGSDQANCDAADGIEYVPGDGGPAGGSDTSDNGVTVTWTYDADTKEVGFTAEGGLVTIAYVKGGSAYNEYDYTGTTDGGVDSDGSMFAPDNASDGPAGLSHLVFCTTPSDTESEAPSEAPSFEGSVEGVTDAPSEPTTDALGTTGTSGPADGAWLLVVALGMLLASIVVLTPARAKGKR